MTRNADTPFDPDTVPRALATGAMPPEIPFMPARDSCPTFEVKNEDSANWVVRKIVEARQYRHRVMQFAERELKRSEREEAFFLEHYGAQLEAWVRAQINQRGGRMKQVRLPAGSVGFRKTLSSLSIKDDTAILAWCKANLPHAVVIDERVLKARLLAHVQNTGECPDGAAVKPSIEKFFIK